MLHAVAMFLVGNTLIHFIQNLVHRVDLCAFGVSTRFLLIVTRLKAKYRFYMTVVHILVLYSIISTITGVAYFVRFMTIQYVCVCIHVTGTM